jgi:hypothetical protein
MRKRTSRELFTDPRFITGIDSYCDRWCERCPLTARCVVFAMEYNTKAITNRDTENSVFWQTLTANSAATDRLIGRWAKEHNIDLTLSEFAMVVDDDPTFGDELAHPLAAAAEEYAFTVDSWIQKERPHPGRSEQRAPDEICTALQVVDWYHFFIVAKIVRGLLSREDEADYEWQSGKDSDGSIKIALLAIDRSLSAWHTLQLLRADWADSIWPFLLRLFRLRLNAELEFPDARAFRRPGFDDIEHKRSKS